MTGFSNPLVGGGGDLVYPDIRSPNFSQSGKTGWAVLKNGTAFFFSVTASGTITATEFDGTDFVIKALGEFFYSGVPSLGNLIATIAPAAGADDGVGNRFKEGFTGYSPGVAFLQMDRGIITIGSLNGTTQITQSSVIALVDALAASAQPGLKLTSPAASGSLLELQLLGQSSDFSKTVQMIVSAGIANPQSAALLEVQGSVTAQVITALVGPAVETWHSMLPLGGGWANTGLGNVGAKYRINAINRVELEGDISGGAIANGTVIFTLPPGYQPADQQRIPVIVLAGAAAAGGLTPHIAVNGAGQLALENLPAGTTRISFNDSVSLDV